MRKRSASLPPLITSFELRSVGIATTPSRVATKFAYTHDSDVDNDPRAFEVTVTFEAQGEKTKVTMHSIFPTAEACNHVKSFGAVELGQQTLAKLDAYAQRMQAR